MLIKDKIIEIPLEDNIKTRTWDLQSSVHKHNIYRRRAGSI